jgi:hypothetical protein
MGKRVAQAVREVVKKQSAEAMQLLDRAGAIFQ